MAGPLDNVTDRLLRRILRLGQVEPIVNLSALPVEQLLGLGIRRWGATASQVGGAAGFAGFALVLPAAASILSVIEKLYIQSTLAGVLHMKPLAAIPLDFNVIQPIVRRDARGSNLITTGVQLPEILSTTHRSGTSAVNPIPLFTSALAWPLQANVPVELDVGYVLAAQGLAAGLSVSASFWLDTVNATLTWNLRGYERLATLDEMQLK